MKLFSIKAILSIKVHSQKIRIYFQNMYFQNAVLFSRKYVFAEKLKSSFVMANILYKYIIKM